MKPGEIRPYDEKADAEETYLKVEQNSVDDPQSKRGYKKILLILIPLFLAGLFVVGILSSFLKYGKHHSHYKKPEVNKFYVVKQELKFNLKLNGDSGRRLQDTSEGYSNSTSSSTTFLVVDSEDDKITMLAIVGEFSIEDASNNLRSLGDSSTSSEDSVNQNNEPLPVFLVEGNTRTGQVLSVKSPENTDISEKNKVITASNQFLVSSDSDLYSDISSGTTGSDPNECTFYEKYGPFSYCPKFSKSHDSKYTILTKSYDSSLKKLTRRLQDVNETISHTASDFVPNDDLKINLTRSSYINDETGELELSQEYGNLNLNLINQEGEEPLSYKYQFEQASSISKIELDLNDEEIEILSDELMKNIKFVEETPDEIKDQEEEAQTSESTQNETQQDHHDRNLGDKLVSETKEIFSVIGISAKIVFEAEKNEDSINIKVYIDIGGIGQADIAEQSVAGDVYEKVKKILAFKAQILNTVGNLKSSLDSFRAGAVSDINSSINAEISQLDQIINDVSSPSSSLPHMLKTKLDAYVADITKLEASNNGGSLENTDWRSAFEERGYLNIENLILSAVTEYNSYIQSTIDTITLNKNKLESKCSTSISDFITNSDSLSSEIIVTEDEVLELPTEGLSRSHTDIYDFSSIQALKSKIETSIDSIQSLLSASSESFKDASVSNLSRISNLERPEDLSAVYNEILTKISEINTRYRVDLNISTSLESIQSQLTTLYTNLKNALEDLDLLTNLDTLKPQYSENVLLKLVSFDEAKKGILDSILGSIYTQKIRLANFNRYITHDFNVITPIGILKIGLNLNLDVMLDLEKGLGANKAFASLVPSANANFEGSAGLSIVATEARASVNLNSSFELANEIGIRFNKFTGYLQSSFNFKLSGIAGLYVKYLKPTFEKHCIRKLCISVPKKIMSDPRWIAKKDYDLLQKHIVLVKKEFIVI